MRIDRREFAKLGITFTLCELLASCGGSSSVTSPDVPPTSTIPSRTFLSSLGGSPFYSFDSKVDGVLYQALNAEKITPTSTPPLTYRDTKTGINFSGSLIYALIIDRVIQPENGFDFMINGREFYDPMNGKSIITDYYLLPVARGNNIAITLPPKWDGRSD